MEPPTQCNPFNPKDEEFFYAVTNPVVEDTVINKVCRKASTLRDIHIIRYIENLMIAGKNLFIVYGGTHAIMQERAIRDLWNNLRDG